jgi:hypothetical protein
MYLYMDALSRNLYMVAIAARTSPIAGKHYCRLSSAEVRPARCVGAIGLRHPDIYGAVSAAAIFVWAPKP